MSSETKPLYENLDTSSVNLWSLLRDLTDQGFIGRVHVELDDYSADIFMNGSGAPTVHEIDRAAGTDTVEEGAMHRVVLRARESEGTISVHEGAPIGDEPEDTSGNAVTAAANVSIAPEHDQNRSDSVSSPARDNSRRPTDPISEDIFPAGSYRDWPAILSATGELIGAVERAINANGEDFASEFSAVRLELADDYSFLDPITNRFHYQDGTATIDREMPIRIFVTALSESLRRTVNRVAVGDRQRRVRERVALELLTVARGNAEVLDRSGFATQLDRIAGARVM
jgi:hypothetical protein